MARINQAVADVPIVGVNMALPIVEQAGENRYGSIVLPMSLELAKRCDGVLRLAKGRTEIVGKIRGRDGACDRRLARAKQVGQ